MLAQNQYLIHFSLSIFLCLLWLSKNRVNAIISIILVDLVLYFTMGMPNLLLLIPLGLSHLLIFLTKKGQTVSRSLISLVVPILILALTFKVSPYQNGMFFSLLLFAIWIGSHGGFFNFLIAGEILFSAAYFLSISSQNFLMMSLLCLVWFLTLLIFGKVLIENNDLLTHEKLRG